MTVITNERNELIPTATVTGWRVCIDYRRLNDATRKNHFPLLFIDQMLEWLSGHMFYCFLDGLSGYFQIPIDPKDQEKMTFTCPFGTFAYIRCLSAYVMHPPYFSDVWPPYLMTLLKILWKCSWMNFLSLGTLLSNVWIIWRGSYGGAKRQIWLWIEKNIILWFVKD